MPDPAIKIKSIFAVISRHTLVIQFERINDKSATTEITWGGLRSIEAVARSHKDQNIRRPALQ